MAITTTQQALTLTPPLSFGGEWSEPHQLIFRETIVLVPFFRAQKVQIRRHAQFLNSLGYRVVLFYLKFEFDDRFFSSQGIFGLKHVWAEQIQKILTEVPGPKILFSFSNPSASAIEALAARRCFEVKALVCEGGPSGRLWSSMYNYYTFDRPIGNQAVRWIASWASAFAWNPKLMVSLHEDLEKIPAEFPILSIQGWKDPLIPPAQIDEVFSPHPHLAWQKLSLPQAGHLNGLKEFSRIYKPSVEKFLATHSSRLGK